MDDNTKSNQELLAELQELRHKYDVLLNSKNNNDIATHRVDNDSIGALDIRMRNAFIFAAIGMAFVAPDGRWLKVNPSLCKMLGYTEDELMNITFQDLTHPDDLELDLDYVRQMLEGKILTYQMEKRYFHKSGYIVWVNLSVSLVRDTHGNPIHFISQIEDITMRKQAEDALKLANMYNRNLIESNIDSIVTIDTDGKIMDVNKATEKATGHTRDKLIGTNFSKYFTEPDKAKMVYEIAFRDGIISDYPLELRHRDNSIKSVLYNATIYKDSYGNVLGVFAAARDITQIKKVEIALRKSEEKYRRIVSTAQEGVWIIDENAQTSYVNQCMTDMLGYTVDEMMGKALFDFMDEEAVNQAKQNFKRRQEGISERHDFRFSRKDGTDLWALIATNSIISDDGTFMGALGMIMDITERKITELELQQSEARLRESNATKDKMFSIVAHDLRGPIGNFRDITNLLSDKYDTFEDFERREFLSIMKNSSNKILELLENLLEWARFQRGMISFSPYEINMSNIIINCIELLAEAAKKKDIAVQNNIPDQTIIKADPNLITIVIRNLISNAIKFTPENGTIRITNQINGNKHIVAISDSGIGISQSTMNKLFNINTHISTRGTSDEKGTGLGLILVKEFVEKHDGKIWAESEVGKGSTFYFSLPRK